MKIKMAMVAVAAMLAAAGPAHAVTTVTTTSYTFNTVGNTPDNGTYGNAMRFDTAQSSTLKMSVTGWQSNQSSNAITTAYVAAYAGGLGVTGIGDANGANNLHQIDNTGGYTDFLMLEFNRAVTLASIKTNSYGINNVVDNDAVWYNASVFTTPTWDSTAGFTNYSTVPSTWSNVAAAGTDGLRTTGASTASTKWLVGAAFLPTTDRNDGFKLSSITVSEQVAAVPEPASWAMMIVGFGVAGGALRRSRRQSKGVAGNRAAFA